MVKNKPKFLIYKTFACHHSVYFDRAFNGIFAEADTQSITFRTDPEIFGILAKWMYTGKICDDGEKEEPTNLKLARLWILGDELLIPQLQNDFLSFYYNRTIAQGSNESEASDIDGYLGMKDYEYVWKNTMPGSPLRKLLMQYVGTGVEFAWFKENCSRFPPEMLSEIAIFQCGQLRAHEDDVNTEDLFDWKKLDIKDYFVKYIKKRR